MKLQIGQTVYCIVEAFEPYHFRIAKCRVDCIPHGSLKEYRILEKGHEYWMQRKDIYETYPEAVKQADKETDKYEKTWGWRLHEKLLRPWRDEGGENRK